MRKVPKLDSKKINEYHERTIWLQRNLNLAIKAIFFLCFVVIVSNFGTVYSCLKNKNQPYMIKVNNVTGEVISSEKLIQSKVNIKDLNDKQINYFLSNFIISIRSITSDEKNYQDRLDNLSYFLTGKSKEQMESSLALNKTLEKVHRGITINVKIRNINKIEENKYQVFWVESHVNELEENVIENYVGTFTVSTTNVKNEKMILINPLGLVITNLSISKTQ